MKITLFIGSLTGGGAERVTSNLANYLSDKHEVSILLVNDNEPDYKINEDVKLVSLYKNAEKSNYLIKNIKTMRRLKKYLVNSDTDLYVVMLPIPIASLLYYKKHIKAPVIISERGDPYTRFESSKIKKSIVKLLYKKAEGYVFQTEYAKGFYDKLFYNEGIVIPNALNKDINFNKEYNSKEKNIVTVGRLADQKNQKLLIEAFNNIKDKIPEYKLTIYGEGPLRNELEDLISKYNLKDRVYLPGFVNPIEEHIGKAEIFVLSSNHEGMPNSLMEAMALGLPCISTDCPAGGPAYLIDNYNNGLLFKVGDTEALENKLLELINDSDLREKLSYNAKDIVKKLDSEVIYKKWEDYILQIKMEYEKDKKEKNG